MLGSFFPSSLKFFERGRNLKRYFFPRMHAPSYITVHTVFLFAKYVRAKCNCDAFALRRARVCELRLTVNRYLVLVATPYPSLGRDAEVEGMRGMRSSTQAPACLAAKRNRVAAVVLVAAPGALTPQLT